MKYLKPLLRHLTSNDGLFCSDGSAASGGYVVTICQTGDSADSSSSGEGCQIGGGNTDLFGRNCDTGTSINPENFSSCLAGNGFLPI